MVVFDIHPWLRMSTGLILGGWIGVPVGCAMTVLFSRDACTSWKLQMLCCAPGCGRAKKHSGRRPFWCSASRFQPRRTDAPRRR